MTLYKHAIIYRVGEAGVMVTGDFTGPYSDLSTALSALGKEGFRAVTALDKSSAGLSNAAGNHVLVCSGERSSND
jgi:hypothetical protein